jgi:hypothetical protein
LIAIGSAAVVLFDVVASVLAERLDFDYGVLAPISYVIYACFAFLAGRLQRSRLAGTIVGGVLALTEATIGWAVSWWIGPGALEPDERSVATVAVTVAIVTVSGAIVAFGAGFVGERSARRAE